MEKIYKIFAGIMLVIVSAACSDDFLEPKPLSFFEPGTTFTTQAGLESALVTCDRHMRHYWGKDNVETPPINTLYMFSDMAVCGTTDNSNVNLQPINLNIQFIPSNAGAQDNMAGTRAFWLFKENYSGIKYTNTIISSIPTVSGLDTNLANKMMGMAYFHRTWRYMNLVFQFGDVPLLSREVTSPKFDYRSTKMEVIIDKLVDDMEFAVEHVPEKADLIGQVNKAGCRHLLIKCLLAKGDFQRALHHADILIDQSGYSLMQNTFGTFENPHPDIHPVTRNVIWDLHRPANKAIAANTEVLHLTINREESAGSRNRMRTMRNVVPFWAAGPAVGLRTPDGLEAFNINWTHFDYRKAYGRGVARMRPTYYATHGGWNNDPTDLRHNTEVGNWMVMEKMRYNSPILYRNNSEYAGQNVRLYDDDGTLLNADTIRTWFDWPHYKVWIEDHRPANANNYEGGTSDWYVYRLAETYLLRAEIHMWMGNSQKAADDVNAVRRRAQCTNLYTAADMNMGIIMDERMRELYYEEFRHDELARVSYIFALTGTADEFGKTYTRSTLSDDSYWYQRVNKYNNYYNKGVSTRAGLEYTISPFHIFFPIPQRVIDANQDGIINQNKGYSGYENNVEPYGTLEEAIAGES